MMYKIELWGKTYETSMRDYVFRLHTRQIGRKEQWGLDGRPELGFTLKVGLYLDNISLLWVISHEVYTTKAFDDLMAYAKVRIESAFMNLVKANDTPLWGYKGDLKIGTSDSSNTIFKANPKWIKTPERLLQIEKIDHIREVPTDDGGGTLFVHVNGEGLYEPKLPFEEACKLLGYQD